MTIDVNLATHAAIKTLMWTETDDDGTSLDANYAVTDLDGDALTQVRQSVSDFVAEAEEDWPNLFGELAEYENISAKTLSLAVGHMFVLTANGHGTGFWDRGYGKAGAYLTDRARPYAMNLHPGDDGNLYVS